MEKSVIIMDRRFCHVNKAHLKGVKLDSIIYYFIRKIEAGGQGRR